MDLQKFFTDYYKPLIGLMGFLGAVASVSINSYFSERAKLKAQLSENKKLVEQSESVKLQYNKELEELKKEHQLEISKRKYQYESKKEQYLKFFKLLDEFSNENNVQTQEKLMPILEEFNKNYLNAATSSNMKNQTTAATVFQKKVQKLILDANQDLIRVKQETNTIRLIASDSIRNKLDALTLAYDNAMDASTEMMKEMLPLILASDSEGLKDRQLTMERAASVINQIKDDIIDTMRQELKEI